MNDFGASLSAQALFLQWQNYFIISKKASPGSFAVE
jgi:hypothetical protein